MKTISWARPTTKRDRFQRLEAWTRERFAMAGSVDYRWSGMVMETIDGLAFIGRNPWDEPNVFIATGDSGMGMTHGTIAGMLISDLILGRENHRDEKGQLYERSGICTHLGCVVHFNAADKTWNCPCHGSQFDHQGNVLTGPATTPLEEPT